MLVLINNKTTSLSFLWANNQWGVAELTITHSKRVQVVVIVLVATLKDCSPKPTILCTFNIKIKKILHAAVFYQRTESRLGTNQICRFPIEHCWVSTNYNCYFLVTMLHPLASRRSLGELDHLLGTSCMWNLSCMLQGFNIISHYFIPYSIWDSCHI